MNGYECTSSFFMWVQFGRKLGSDDVSTLLASIPRVVELECAACSRQGCLGTANRKYSGELFLSFKHENLDPLDSEVVFL